MGRPRMQAPTGRLPNRLCFRSECTLRTVARYMGGLLRGSKQSEANLPSYSPIGLERDHSSIHTVPEAAERIGEVELLFDGRKGLVWRRIHLYGSNLR